jgi:hypothetical protein
MSTAISQKETRIHLLFLLYGMVIISLMVLMVVRLPQDLKEDIEAEMHHTVEYLSEPEHASLQKRAQDRYQYWLHDSGVYAVIYGALVPADQKTYAEEWQSGASLGIISDTWIYRVLRNFQLYFYQITHRITLMEFWLLSMLPMMLATVATGYYQWQVKLYQMTGQSTSLVRIWLKILWFVLFLFLAYLITPNLFGPYTIFAPPVLLMLVALCASYVVSNFSKSV